MRQKLERITSGELKRLMIFMPPQHGKTSMVTIRYPVWRLERDPTMRVIVGAYNQSYASDFGLKARRIAVERMPLSEERAAVTNWQTVAGGGYRAVGVGAGVTGHAGELIVIDDPVKSREEANSEAYRERTWDWYTNDLYTRLQPGAAIMLIMTRWHEDDLAGRLLEQEAEKWEVLSLPAEAEPGDALGRELGEALCPERFPKEALAVRRAVLGRAYYALYQQNPQPLEGGMFKRPWFTIVPDAPSRLDRSVRWWDKAASDDEGNYTAGVLIGYRGKRYYVLDVVRGRWSTHEREKVILQTAHRDLASRAEPVDIWMEQEGGSGGKDSAKMTIQNLAGFNVHAEPSTGSKETRAEPFAAQCEAGNVVLVRGEWNGAYIDELCAFPTGRNDDQVDASSGAFNKLALKRGRAYVIPW